jgi:hypothetical protein
MTKIRTCKARLIQMNLRMKTHTPTRELNKFWVIP